MAGSSWSPSCLWRLIWSSLPLSCFPTPQSELWSEIRWTRLDNLVPAFLLSCVTNISLWRIKGKMAFCVSWFILILQNGKRKKNGCNPIWHNFMFYHDSESTRTKHIFKSKLESIVMFPRHEMDSGSISHIPTPQLPSLCGEGIFPVPQRLWHLGSLPALSLLSCLSGSPRQPSFISFPP